MWIKLKTICSEMKQEKLVYSLEEVSRIVRLKSDVINSWEEEFYFLHAGQTASGKKIFRKRDVDIIARLKDLIENQDFTLAGAKRKIEEEFSIKTPTAVHPDRLKKVLIQVKEQLKELVSSLENK
jgi:DNA-binding transcriptional MerR regulator